MKFHSNVTIYCYKNDSEEWSLFIKGLEFWWTGGDSRLHADSFPRQLPGQQDHGLLLPVLWPELPEGIVESTYYGDDTAGETTEGLLWDWSSKVKTFNLKIFFSNKKK